jgi:hypothetical protein
MDGKRSLGEHFQLSTYIQFLISNIFQLVLRLLGFIYGIEVLWTCIWAFLDTQIVYLFELLCCSVRLAYHYCIALCPIFKIDV